MKPQKDRIIIGGEAYTPEELEANCAELLNPAQTVQPQSGKEFYFKSTFFLAEDDFGRKIHDKVIAKYSDVDAITKIKIGKGSNPFYVVAVSEVLRAEFPKLRTATQADLERILRENLLGLKGTYEDSGLVLRNRQEPNSYLANSLYQQFSAQGKTLQESIPYVLWLHNLSLQSDLNSPHKLTFQIPKGIAETDFFQALILNQPSQQTFDSADVDVKTGIPTKLGSGTRNH